MKGMGLSEALAAWKVFLIAFAVLISTVLHAGHFILHLELELEENDNKTH